MTARLWVERLALTDFRNYASATLNLGPEPVVLTGSNGSGKTNILEAVSLLSAGQGLRRAPFPDLARTGGTCGWAVAAAVHTPRGRIDIGTGLAALSPSDTRAHDVRPPDARTGRLVRIDGANQTGSGALADHVEMVWLTPATDGLFTGAAGDRRRFLDRLVVCFDAGHRTRSGHFERAMASRNRLLADGVTQNAQLMGLERIMAEQGVAIAAARAEVLSALETFIARRREADPGSPFPWSRLALDGGLDATLATLPAVDVEEGYAARLAASRERDRAAGRSLDGPHRSDLVVTHGPKDMPARLCSTGEQKALLLGLVLAHAALVRERQEDVAPLLLLDEVTAHLDAERRAALCEALLALEAQAWLTGTDKAAFAALGPRAQYLRIEAGSAHPEAAP